MLDFKKDDESIRHVIFFNDSCNETIDYYCALEDDFGINVDCNPIGALPKEMSVKLSRIKNEIFKNEEIQRIVSCFKSITLFKDDVDFSECEKGAF